MDSSFSVAKEAASILANKTLQDSGDYTVQHIHFILHLFYLSDILGVMNHYNCYIQGPGSNIVDFAIKLTTSRVGKVRLASRMRLFDPRNVALQLFVRKTEDLFLFCNCTYEHPPFSSLAWSKTFFLVFDSSVATLRLSYFSASGCFNENLPTL